MQKKALGRGLQTLIPVATGGRDEIEEIQLSLVSPNPYQPRRAINTAELEELASSVKAKGVLQPILVRRLGDGGYEVIAGERRWRAAKLAGLKKIPAIVRLATDVEAMEMALIENLQRKDLNAMEAARAYQRLIKEFGLTQEAVARQLGKERSSIANTVRLLSLQSEVQVWVENDQLSGSETASRTFACPRDNWSFSTHTCTSDWSDRSRTVLAIDERSLPSCLATASCVSPNSLMRRRYATAASSALRSSRSRVRVTAISTAPASVASRT